MKQLAITILTLIASLSAITINVPTDQTTIQGGLNIAISADTVLVQPGTYYENIIWPETNGIELISAGDSSNTIIDGGGLASVIYINPQTVTLDTTTLIQGIKIRNGSAVNGGGVFLNASIEIIAVAISDNHASYGGGMYFISSSPSITGVTISGNYASNSGAGMYLHDSSPSITNVNICDNFTDMNGGGGMCLEGESSPSITGVTISGNAANVGGGIYLSSSSPSITDVTISGNYASNSGGGMDIRNSNPLMSGVVISGNHASSGGGMYLKNSSNPSMFGVVISGNTASYGGGMYFISSSPSITGVTISGNYASSGGGMYLIASSPSITGVTISDNTATTGGGMHIYGSYPSILNVTITGNTASSGGGMYLSNSSNPSISGVSINDNSSGIHIVSGNLTISPGNAIYNNGSGIINDDNTAFINASNNYWGQFTGPYHPLYNTGGQGDSTNTFVNITPWLTTPTDTLIGSPLTINEISLKTNGAFTQDLSDNIEVGDSLFIQLEGIDTEALTKGLAVVWIVNTISLDTIVVTLSESDINSGLFRGIVSTGSSTNNEINTILGENGQVLKIISHYYPNINTMVIIGDTPLPIVSDFILAGELDLMHTISHTPVFSWSYMDPLNAPQASYDVQVSTDVNFSILDMWDSGVISGTDTSLVYAGSALLDGQTYYTRIQVTSAIGIHNNYTEMTIRMNAPPSVPTVLSPIDESIFTETVPSLLILNSSDSELDILSYDFQLAADELFTSIFDSSYNVSGGTDSTSWQVATSLGDNSQYWWRARANDGFESGEFSTATSFILNAQNEPPCGFALLTPANDVAGLSDIPAFLWQQAEDPDPMDYATYTLQIASDSSFSELVFEANTNVEAGLQLTEALPTDTKYWWRVLAIDTDSLTTESEVFKFTVGYVSIAGDIALPTEYMLNQNYPNPFNPSTTIRYGLPEDSHVSLVIYDLRGNVVQTLESGTKLAGWYDVVWYGETSDGKAISTGLYFARIVAGDRSQVIKMLYLK